MQPAPSSVQPALLQAPNNQDKSNKYSRLAQHISAFFSLISVIAMMVYFILRINEFYTPLAIPYLIVSLTNIVYGFLSRLKQIKAAVYLRIPIILLSAFTLLLLNAIAPICFYIYIFTEGGTTIWLFIIGFTIIYTQVCSFIIILMRDYRLSLIPIPQISLISPQGDFPTYVQTGDAQGYEAPQQFYEYKYLPETMTQTDEGTPNALNQE
ncbi:hypothetical protein FGO68_gene15330 [Halteria grandinella]|uniref:Uncharacterized protein n=1 Tax=Halteria grandinella TaxID=5974 RepID=A0A8J8SYY8_HALGN|nr:hypothetical protein FGO68_gene15330 [Halteria grandinella]